MVSTLERPAEVASLLQLDPRELIPDSRNERGEITPETDPDLDGLVASIKENGVLEPLRVYRGDLVTEYIVSSGHRRRAAAILAGLEAIPCIVVAKPHYMQGEIDRVVSNIQRRDINPVALAVTLKGLRESYPDLSQAALAAKLGMSQPALANLVRLLRLPDNILDYLTDGRLSAGHGQALLRILDHGHFSDWQGNMTAPEQYAMELAMRWVANGTSVHEAEDSTKNHLSQQKHIKQSVEAQDAWRRQQRETEAQQASISPEELEAKRKEERRERMAEGRARTKRVKAAQAAMMEALRIFGDQDIEGSQYMPLVDLEHIRFMALALNKGYMLADTRKAWGIAAHEEIERDVMNTNERELLLVIAARLAIAQMLEITYDGKGFSATNGWHERVVVEERAEKAWGIKEAIDFGLRRLDEGLLMNQAGK